MINRIPVKIKAVRHFKDGLILPTYKYQGDAGFDLRYWGESEAIISPGRVTQLATGLAFEVPHGYEMQIRARSGLAVQGVSVVNAPGTVDAGFRGEVILLMIGAVYMHPVVVQPGDRVAQGVLAAVTQGDFEFVDELGPSDRGQQGYGSSGLK